jgi:CheY-like chemotaxis protein
MADEGKRLLVVEDNPAEAHVIGFVLRQAGYDVTVASDGRTAWDLLNGEEFDLVVSDFTMPGMTGGELCARMRKDGRLIEIPFILLTARALELKSLVHQSQMSVSVVISKPFSPRELKQRVSECLAGCATVDWSAD